jgi:sugar fermentation stimulation protein A
MLFPALVYGRLVRRYKRFLADIMLDDGREITAHCANPGAMLGLAQPGLRVALSWSANPARKLPFSWELVEIEREHGFEWVGINTARPNELVEAAIRSGTIGELQGYPRLRREVAYGRNSRVDIVLEADDRPNCFVEVKNAHLFRQVDLVEFPDCVTARGAKHLDELGDRVEAGERAVMVYLIQATAKSFALAADLDPVYATAFERARQRGVEAIAYACHVTPSGIEVRWPVTVLA